MYVIFVYNVYVYIIYLCASLYAHLNAGGGMHHMRVVRGPSDVNLLLSPSLRHSLLFITVYARLSGYGFQEILLF